MSDITCRYCKHSGVIIDSDPIYCEGPLQKYCPADYLFNHPNPPECPNFLLDRDLWHYDNLPYGKVLKTIEHPNGAKEPILECPRCHRTGTPYKCQDFAMISILHYRCVKCDCEFKV